jgi:hypothetical protein
MSVYKDQNTRPVNHCKRWSVEDEAIVMRAEEPDHVLALKLGRKTHSIDNQRHRIRMRGPRR